jgi:hypothetical protein
MPNPPWICAEPHERGGVPSEVIRWVAALPSGTSGTAGELLPSFLASGAPPRTGYGAPWSAVSLGLYLARLCKLAPRGVTRVSRVTNRKGNALWHFAGPV